MEQTPASAPQVRVYINHARAKFVGCDQTQLEALDRYFSYFDPKAKFTLAYAAYLEERADAEKEERLPNPKIGWDGRKHFLFRESLPAGLFRAKRADVERDLNLRFEVLRKRQKLKELKTGLAPNADHKYRYQEQCAQRMCEALPRGGGMILAATRTGKTAMTARFFARIPYSALFIVDQIDLLYQQQEELADWLKEKIGVVGNSKYEPERITVATIQTLARHLKSAKFKKWFKTVQVVIVDELHEQLAKRNFKVLFELAPIARYGLTATLQLKQKAIWMTAYAFAGPVLFHFPIQKGVATGVLTAGRAIQLLFPAKSEGADYHTNQEIQVVNNPLKRVAVASLIYELWNRGLYILVLTERPVHVQKLSRVLQHIPHGVAYGDIEREERKAVREKFETGEIRLIFATRVFKKGVTIKRLDCIFDLAEGASENDTQQKYGRGTGLCSEKTGLLYIDIGTQGTRGLAHARRRKKALEALGVSVVTQTVQSTEAALETVKLNIQESKL